MPRNAANLAPLRRLASRVPRAATEAVAAGLPILEAGLLARCPTRATRVHRSIHRTRTGHNADFAGGFVVIPARGALAVERRHPFIAPTIRQDGPRAVKAMEKALRRLLSV
jgi:hypothetical protein